MTVDLDSKVEVGDGTMQTPFALVPEGSIEAGNPILMEFTGKVQLCGEENESLMVELNSVDNPDARSSVFCKLSDQKGLTKLMDIIAFSGVEKKIKRVKPEFDINNLTGRTLIHPGFHDQLKNCLPGCQVHATVKHSKGKNKEGVEQVYANITRLAEVKKSGPGTIPATGTVATPTTGTPAQAPADAW